MADEQNDRPRMEKEKDKNRPGMKTPKFNIYWVYIVIALILLGIQFFPFTPSLKLISWEKFNTDMLQTHDVEKLTVVNGKTVEVTIKEDKLNEDKYKEVSRTNINTVNKGPHYYFKILSPDDFSKKLETAQKDFTPDEVVSVYPEDRTNWSDWMGIILPILVIVGLWLFVMRRVSGGMGPGGQIF